MSWGLMNHRMDLMYAIQVYVIRGAAIEVYLIRISYNTHTRRMKWERH